MKFTRFQVWEVVVPARADLIAADGQGGAVYSQAVTWPDLPIFLVEGELDKGVRAVGEATRGESRESVEKTLRGLLDRPLDTWHPAGLWTSSTEPSGLPSKYPLPSWKVASGMSYMLVESLWLDAVGKLAGLPAHALLGGALRGRVEVDFWANRPDAARLRRIIEEAAALGLKGIKLKGTSAGETARAVAAVANDAPEGFHFTIDPMCSWRTLRESTNYFDQLANCGRMVRIEDPFGHSDIREWKAAASAFPTIPLIFHARNQDVLRIALAEGIGDALNLGGGSLFDFLGMAGVAGFHLRDCWQGSALELGILQAARLHAAACAANCVLPSDLQSEWVREHTLVTPRMQYADGVAIVPQTPGLGVSQDREAVSKYARCKFEIAA